MKKIKNCSKCHSNFVRLRIPGHGSLKRIYADGTEELVRGYWVECFDCGKNGETKYEQIDAIKSWNEENNMKLGAYIYFDLKNKEIEFLDKPVSLNNEQIGKITKSYIKDGKVWIEMTINENKVKQIRKKLGE